jgi:Transposase DDE domain
MEYLTSWPPAAAASPVSTVSTTARALTTELDEPASVPPPRRRRRQEPAPLHLHAVQVLALVGLLPLAATILGWAAVGRRRHAALVPPRQRGRPPVYSDASIVVLALLGRLWQLSTRELCAWLDQWPALAAACGLPPGRIIHPAHLRRRISQLGAFPFWLLYLALVWQALRGGLLTGRDVALDSTLLAAWSRHDPDAAWSYPSKHHGRVFGYKVHVLLDRFARLPLFFLISPANRNDLPFAYPLLWLARVLLRVPIHVVRADGAYWGWHLVEWIVTVLRARPIIPFNRKKQPLQRVRHLVWAYLSYAARAIIERFFGIAKRYYGLDTEYAIGWDAVVRRVTLTMCAILVVALAAQRAGAPELRLSPSRVLAHYQPVDPHCPCCL